MITAATVLEHCLDGRCTDCQNLAAMGNSLSVCRKQRAAGAQGLYGITVWTLVFTFIEDKGTIKWAQKQINFNLFIPALAPPLSKGLKTSNESNFSKDTISKKSCSTDGNGYRQCCKLFLL